MPPKKITIKPFLNKNLPKIVAKNGVDTMYPLYYQVTYQRKNTQIKSFEERFYTDLNNLLPEEKAQIDFEMQVLHKTIEYRIAIEKNEFTIAGIKVYFDVCALPLIEVVEGYLNKKLQKSIKYANTEFLPILKFEGFDVKFSTLLKAIQMLIPNVHLMFPKEFKLEIEAYKKCREALDIMPEKVPYYAVADWIDYSIHNDIFTALVTNIGLKEENAKKYMAILGLIVEERINFL